MVIVRLAGGLGNQMFQYALGRCLASVRGAGLHLDHSFLEDRTPRPDFAPREYALGVFDLQPSRAPTSSVKQLERAKPALADRVRYRILGAPVPYYRYPHVRERSHAFDPRIFDAPRVCLLDGYWQSEKYFAAAADEVRHDFRQAVPEGPIAERIRATNSVAIHVRRGDYVTIPRTNALHGTLPPGYYFEAIRLVTAKTAEPRFFVFSDDIGWCREQLAADVRLEFVSGETPDPARDLALMRRCRHQIIANSSLSWWAAWLNDDPEKIVVAPRRWFRDDAIPTGDVIPAGWLRL